MRVKKKLPIFMLLLSIACFAVLAPANLQAIEDWTKLRGYTPPAAITQLAAADTMTAKAQHLFFINHPQLVSDKNQFRQDCLQAEQTIVLGCYHSVEAGIDIYNVTDPRLNGIQEVTAAHEMLHGAYDRLSQKDKNYVDGMLQDYYNNVLTDQRVKDVINSYKQSEPNSIVDEMHSIFGTEISNLPVPLENYYKQYFSNRMAVADFSIQYESVFTQNQHQLQSLKTQIDQQKTQLDTDKQAIQNQEATLTAENQRMQSLLRSGQADAYNSGVDAYNAQVQSLKSAINSYNARVNQVNDLVGQYNNLAYTQEGLYNSIDTRL